MSDATQGEFTLKQIRTRFLYPFFFNRHRVAEAVEALTAWTLSVPERSPIGIWRQEEPHTLYTEELLHHVAEFLFDYSSSLGCRYLKISSALCNRWSGKLEFYGPNHEKNLDQGKYKVALVEPMTIELFLSGYGVGVISIALSPEGTALSLEQATEFNYRVSQLRKNTAGALHIRHPADDPKSWQELPLKSREAIPPQVATDAPLSARLCEPGGTFTLKELIQELLRPLDSFDHESVQEQLSVYTTALFDDMVDFGREDARRALAPFVSALAQVEEADHSGAPEGTVGVTNDIFNRRHWFGVGLIGAAHLAANQPPPEHPFNSARLPRLMLKYFTPFLAATLQRLTIQRISRRASVLGLSDGEGQSVQLLDLRKRLLEFAVKGYFTEVSRREVMHRYYRLCQKGLNVFDAMSDVRRAISDIDAKFTTDRQIKLAEDIAGNAVAARNLQTDMTAHLEVVADVQKKVELIEIVLVSVYVAHLWEMFASHVHILEPYVPHGVLAGAALGALWAILVLKPFSHGKHTPKKSE
jgi:hypothetical protein